MQQKRIPIKNHIEEIRLINRRVIVVLIMIALFIIVLLTRLYYLQSVKHDLYTTLSKKNWLDLVPIEPTRGLIYDRNGVLLADNVPVFSLDVIPYKVNNLHQALADIQEIIPLTDTELTQFHKELKEHRRFEEIPLKLRLTEADLARFAENQYRFPGLIIKARLIRYYPYGKSLTPVLGYVGRINLDDLKEIDIVNYSASNYIGKLGIEKFYEEELHGKVGYQQVENDASGETTRVLKQINPMPGEALYLTLDINLQLAAEQALQGHRGAIVAIQPSTGQVLAMVSSPSYDPNLFVAGISNKEYQALQNSPDKPLYNRALRGLYPLASTIKPYLALQGLETGTTTPDYTIYDPGWFRLKNSEHLFRDHHAHGIVNLEKAIITSCDTYFYELSTRLGIDRMDDILDQFGFGETTGVDLNDELAGVVASPHWKEKNKGMSWYPGDTVNSAIGQGYMQATPLQLAVAVSTMANRGTRFSPYFLFAERQVGKPVTAEASVPLNAVKLSNPKNWETVINAMEGVIFSAQGTGYRFGKNVAYTVAAKTGTAQVFSIKRSEDDRKALDQNTLPERLRDHSLFIAFAPVDHPEIAIAVIAENTTLAPSVARKVLDYYLLKHSEKEIKNET
jgi:penicillin-binding protein 2